MAPHSSLKSMFLASMIAFFSLQGYINASPATLLGTSCISAPGYLCTSISLNNYNLTFTFGQNTGATEYNAFITVAAQGSPLNRLGFPTQGIAYPAGGAGMTLKSGSQITITVPAPNSSVTYPSSAGYYSYSGNIWLNYSANNSLTPANYAVKVSTFNVRATPKNPKAIPYIGAIEFLSAIIVTVVLFLAFARKRK